MKKTIKQLKKTRDWAKEYIKRGWPVMQCFRAKAGGDCECPASHPSRKNHPRSPACKSPGKHPVANDGFKSATIEPVQIEKRFANEDKYNLAIRTGQNTRGVIVVIDVDKGEGKPGPATLAALEKRFGKLPPTLVQKTGSDGEHYVFAARRDSAIKSGTNILRTEAGLPAKDANGKATKSGIDVRAENGYIMVEPSNHTKGKYQWKNYPAEIAALPEWLERALTTPQYSVSPEIVRSASVAEKDQPHETLTPLQVRELLNSIPSDDRDTWLIFGNALKTIAQWIGGTDDAFRMWTDWSASGDGFQGEEDQAYHWASFNNPTLHPIALLKKHAVEYGWVASDAFKQDQVSVNFKWAMGAANALTKESQLDHGREIIRVLQYLPPMERESILQAIKRQTKWSISALRSELATTLDGEGQDIEDGGLAVARGVLSKHYQDGSLIIRPEDKCFWTYNAKYWGRMQNDDELFKHLIQEAVDLGLPSKRVSIRSIADAGLRLLEGLTAMPGDRLRLQQQQPRVINCQNGELWLTENNTVELRKHDPESFLTFCLDVEYHPSATCPLFDQTLLEIFAKSTDPNEMARHFLELFGYTIQPRRNHKSWWMLYGTGNNGKTKLIQTMQLLMSPRAVFSCRIGDIEKDQHKIAALTGKLMMIDDDVAAGTVLPDGFLKKISEEKLLSGRHLYAQSHEFVVTVAPILLVNNFPYSKDLSPGTQKRAHIIPFSRCFEGEEEKKGLFPDIWKRELPGILNRAIEGYIRLETRGGFLEPEDCKLAKRRFLAASNPLVAFIEECCSTLAQKVAQVESEYEVTRKKLIKGGATQAKLEELEQRHKVDRAKVMSLDMYITTKEFYDEFKKWCLEEGSSWIPRKPDVERDLGHLGFAVAFDPHKGQKVVRGLDVRM